MKVEIAKQAVEIAKDFLETAGWPVSMITKAESQENFWIIEATTLMGAYRLKIDKESGEVIEYGKIE